MAYLSSPCIIFSVKLLTSLCWGPVLKKEKKKKKSPCFFAHDIRSFCYTHFSTWRRPTLTSLGWSKLGWTEDMVSKHISSPTAAAVCELVCHIWLCDPSPPGFSVHEILQARILDWAAIPSSRGSSWPRDQTWVSCIAYRLFTIWATREDHSCCRA